MQRVLQTWNKTKQRISKSVLNTLLIYLDDNHKEVIWYGETLFFT